MIGHSAGFSLHCTKTRKLIAPWGRIMVIRANQHKGGFTVFLCIVKLASLSALVLAKGPAKCHNAQMSKKPTDDSLTLAAQRLNQALEQLEARAGQLLMQVQKARNAEDVDEDRSRLAAELDDARTRAALMEDAARDAGAALDAAISDVRAALEDVS